MEKKYSTTADFTKLASETLKETHDSSFIWGQKIFDDDCFQNMLVYQSLLDMLEFKKDKVTDCSQLEVEGGVSF